MKKTDKILDSIIESKFMNALIDFIQEHPTLFPAIISIITTLLLWFLPKIFFKIFA